MIFFERKLIGYLPIKKDEVGSGDTIVSTCLPAGRKAVRSIFKSLGFMQKSENGTIKILLADKKIRENAIAQIAHLFFADTQANTEKPKELFFANARSK